MYDERLNDKMNSQPANVAASAVERLVRFTAWEDIKGILSDKMLWWASCLLPKESPERKELLVFTLEYLKRSVARRKE